MSGTTNCPPMQYMRVALSALCALAGGCGIEPAKTSAQAPTDDPVRELQNRAVDGKTSSVLHWGTNPAEYGQWSNHTNRLIPVYTFGTRGGGAGVDLDSYTGRNSPYRSEKQLERLYGRVPPKTVRADADYLDQCNIYDLQLAALTQGRKHIFLVIFDGMDWHASLAAAIVRKGTAYSQGRGNGLFFLDYQAGGSSQFAYMVTSPFAGEPRWNVDAQSVGKCEPTGGYDADQGGRFPWSPAPNPQYLKGTEKGAIHEFTDSASSATSMTTGIKTYNRAINVGPDGSQATTIAHRAQHAGYRIGVVTSVAISHATPAAAYAHNVTRTDYQDISRDLLGLKSISHPLAPLPGVDVLIGTGVGAVADAKSAKDQGANFVPGNEFIAAQDLAAINHRTGGHYVVSVRTAGARGGQKLMADAEEALKTGRRLFGFFGTRYEHLPFATADLDFRPANDRKGTAQVYTTADIFENPTLAEMTRAALTVLSTHGSFWLMLEAGDVDLAMHSNNVDTMIGAIYSGDEAVRAIVEWVEKHSNWNESLMIVTADHGHYLVIDDADKLAEIARLKP